LLVSVLALITAYAEGAKEVERRFVVVEAGTGRPIPGALKESYGLDWIAQSFPLARIMPTLDQQQRVEEHKASEHHGCCRSTRTGQRKQTALAGTGWRTWDGLCLLTPVRAITAQAGSGSTPALRLGKPRPLACQPRSCRAFR